MLSTLRLDRELWIRSFVAVGGLALAFGAAVFSTVTRQAGQVWATVILASLALLLAGVVGLTSVPYLVRRMSLHRVRDAFDYEITREGLVYLAVILVIGIAALNTGNNLLFIVISAMLAAILVSGLTSAWMLRGLSVEPTLPAHLFAGQRHLARLSLRNHRRYVPAFSVSIVPPKARVARRLRWEQRSFGFPRRKSGSEQWLRVPDLALKLHSEARKPLSIFQQQEYFPFLAARAAVARDVELHFPRRGRYTQEEFGISTRFPFSFLVKTRRLVIPPQAWADASGQQFAVSAGRELVVFPSVEPTDELFQILPLITGEFESFVHGRGNDLYLIRDYLPGDSARHVDWKGTARSNSLKVREFTREDERKVRIVFDNPEPERISPEAYERAVTMAASLAWHFAGEQAELSFVAPGYSQEGDVHDFLRYLALIEPGGGPAPKESVLEALLPSGTYNVVFTARPRGSLPTALWEGSYFVFLNELR